MGVLVIGDVHGCYHTFKTLVSQHFNPEKHILIQLGDLINKGPHSAQCIKYAFELEQANPAKVFFLRGNHEQAFINAYRQKKHKETHANLRKNLKEAGLKSGDYYQWLVNKPLSWQGNGLLVSHAGVGQKAKDPYNLSLAQNILENRKPLKNMPVTQVVGHQVVKGAKPFFSTKENAWYIDTGAFLGKSLTGILFNLDLPEVFQTPTVYQDLLA